MSPRTELTRAPEIGHDEPLELIRAITLAMSYVGSSSFDLISAVEVKNRTELLRFCFLSAPF